MLFTALLPDWIEFHLYTLYTLFRPFLWLLFRALIGLYGGLKTVGRNNTPREGGLIIAPNHQSYADPFAVGLSIRRPVWFLTTDEVFKNRTVGAIAKFLHAIPIKQDSPDRAALRRAIGLLKSGDALVVFPEGHLSETGELQALQPGILLMAIQANAPILPVHIWGTPEMLPPHETRLRIAKQPLRVLVGKPLSIEELTGGLKGREAIAHGVERLTAAMKELEEGWPTQD